MTRPRVVVHNLVSVDGRLDGVPTDVALYYELAGRFPQQAVLSGSGTMLAAAVGANVDFTAEDERPPGRAPHTDAGRPWLVVVDSAGRLTRFAWLRDTPHWRDVVVLASAATPPAHLERLRRLDVAHEVVGADKVDLARGLEILAERYEVRALRVDAGPALNAALLRAGLVDEISVVVAPYAVGSGGAQALHLLGPLAGSGPLRLEPTVVQQLRDGHLWLRYEVAQR